MAAAPREAEARRQLVARAEAVGAMVMGREVACSALVHMVGELRGGTGISVVEVSIPLVSPVVDRIHLFSQRLVDQLSVEKDKPFA